MTQRDESVSAPTAPAEPATDVNPIDESLLPKPTLRERARNYRKAMGWRHVLAVVGGATVAAGGVFLVKKRRG